MKNVGHQVASFPSLHWPCDRLNCLVIVVCLSVVCRVFSLDTFDDSEKHFTVVQLSRDVQVIEVRVRFLHMFFFPQIPPTSSNCSDLSLSLASLCFDPLCLSHFLSVFSSVPSFWFLHHAHCHCFPPESHWVVYKSDLYMWPQRSLIQIMSWNAEKKFSFHKFGIKTGSDGFSPLPWQAEWPPFRSRRDLSLLLPLFPWCSEVMSFACVKNRKHQKSNSGLLVVCLSGHSVQRRQECSSNEVLFKFAFQIHQKPDPCNWNPQQKCSKINVFFFCRCTVKTLYEPLKLSFPISSGIT